MKSSCADHSMRPDIDDIRCEKQTQTDDHKDSIACKNKIQVKLIQ